MLRLSFSTLSDHRGSDPALLPLGNQCLDWSDRHRRVSSCTILRGHQAVPNTKEHSGEYLIGSSSRESDHFQGRNHLNVSWMDCRTFMVPRGWIPLTPSMRVTFVVQWNFYRMEACAVSLQAMRRLFILHHHHVTTSVCPALWFTSLWALQPQRDFYFVLIMLESSWLNLLFQHIIEKLKVAVGFYWIAWLPTIISHAGIKCKQLSVQFVCQRDHKDRGTQSWSILVLSLM